jgi:hypothetical protein
VAVGAIVCALLSTAALAQTEAGQAGQQRGQRGGRAGLPPVPANMSQQQLQAYLDTFTLIEAERQLQLNDDHYPAFVSRYRHVQQLKRRQLMERRRLTEALRVAATSANPNDDDLVARLRALDDFDQTISAELRKAYSDVDSQLTPLQRARLRLLEEQVERRKLELLMKLGVGRGGRGGGGN